MRDCNNSKMIHDYLLYKSYVYSYIYCYYGIHGYSLYVSITNYVYFHSIRITIQKYELKSYILVARLTYVFIP